VSVLKLELTVLITCICQKVVDKTTCVHVRMLISVKSHDLVLKTQSACNFGDQSVSSVFFPFKVGLVRLC